MAHTTEENGINWDDLYTQLYSYAHALLYRNVWYRSKSDSFISGKQVHDYVMDAIEKYLTEPHKFDPKKGKLIQYLTCNLIRSMVSNDVRSEENRTSTDLATGHRDEETGKSYQDALTPLVEAFFDEEVDYHTIISHIETSLEGDEITKEIFLGIVAGLKRSEIIEEFKMKEKEFDNGMRRLKTVQKNAAQHFNLIPVKS